MVAFLRMLSNILTEKEKKIKEGMRIMGMSDTPFYTSHITYQLIIYTIISALQALILQSSVFVNSDFLVIWIWLWLFCWTLIALNIFISSIFTTVKMGNIVGSLLYLGLYILTFSVADKDLSQSNKIAWSLVPQVGLTFGGDTLLIVEQN